jgi:hypothetical protein
VGPCRLAILAVAICWAGSAAAQDRLTVDGLVDLRWVHADGPLSYVDGGIGTLRFDAEHEGVRLGRAMLASKLRISDEVSVHSVIDAYGDHNGNSADLSEFWLEYSPFPTQSVRWRARVGAFFMPVSLENRGPGWSDVYSITPSAINTWLGDEFRTVGAELEARWLGVNSDYRGDVALIASVYGWNDEAGGLLAEQGFALTDRPSTLFGGVGLPRENFYHEIDHKPGFYAGIDWHHHDWLEVRALRYDNKADPGADTVGGGSAWRTRFSSLGLRLEPSSYLTILLQYLDGDTATGADWLGDDQFVMRYHAAYVLASVLWNRDRFTVRGDAFGMHQESGLGYGPPNNETGHAATISWTHDFGDHWQSAVEWVRASSNFPPRVEYGVPTALLETQTQVAVRYRIRGGIW